VPQLTDLSIQDIIDQVLRGQVRVPQFQRGFVWEPDAVAYFMDSIYKGFPYGSLLLWRTREPLRSERHIGPFDLPMIDPVYPLDYVLDGQQRITSIFGVFQTQLSPTISEQWTHIYYDMAATTDVQESQFVALEDSKVDPNRHFALKHLFDSATYRQLTRNLSDADAAKVDRVYRVFAQARLPVQYIETDDRATVAIIFERVNRFGVPLDTLQLLSAWTWSEDFTLLDKFEDLTAELTPFGFKEVGEDSNLLLRCCAAILAGDAAPSTLITLNGATVRDRFQEIANGVTGAIDFLRTNLNTYSLDNLPYTTFLVPLSVFFAVPGNAHARYTDEQRRVLIRWFWRSCFSKRYSSGVLRNLKTDIEGMNALKRGNASSLGSFSVSVDAQFFRENTFRTSNVNTKTLVLLLAQKRPLSFVSGSSVSLAQVLKDYNRNEFHHLYPRAYLQQQGVKDDAINQLTNFCFMSKADNIHLGGVAPSAYRAKMPADVNAILDHSLCPISLFKDDFDAFMRDRSQMLASEVDTLIQ